MADKSNNLDQYDRAILRELARDGRITVTELSERVNLSKTPCQTRIKRLEARGFILGYHAALNAHKLGRDHIAFVQVKLNNTRQKALEAFNVAVRACPEIEECHMIASSFDYLLKVRSRDIGDYRVVMGEVISALPHVTSTSTFVAMEAVKEGSTGSGIMQRV